MINIVQLIMNMTNSERRSTSVPRETSGQDQTTPDHVIVAPASTSAPSKTKIKFVLGIPKTSMDEIFIGTDSYRLGTGTPTFGTRFHHICTMLRLRKIGIIIHRNKGMSKKTTIHLVIHINSSFSSRPIKIIIEEEGKIMSPDITFFVSSFSMKKVTKFDMMSRIPSHNMSHFALSSLVLPFRPKNYR